MEAVTINKKYQIPLDVRFKYIAILLINEIINFQKYFPVNLKGKDVLLDNYLKYMLNHKLLEINDGKYIPTQDGRTHLTNFYAKYFEFLKVFDIFCAVDLERGEFAFSKIYDMNDDEWKAYLNEERFSDVRVAVAEFKKIDPLQIVFMSFLNQGRFETDKDNWQERMTSSSIWDEISNVCQTAIPLDHLRENDVIQDIVKQGSEEMLRLLKDEEAIKAKESNDDAGEETIVEETVTTEEYVDIVEPPYYDYVYFSPYVDIYYVSPIWFIPLFL